MTKVVVAGGGVGGLEAVLALQAHMSCEITLVSASDAFVYRPWSVGEPFGRGGTVAVDLAAFAADRGIALEVAPVDAVDTLERTVITARDAHPYDHLVLALGAAQVEVVEGAFTFRGPDNAAALGKLLESGPERIAFVATASAVWPLPAYELALLTASRYDAEVTLVTAEAAPLEAFGPEHSAEVGELLEAAGVELITGAIPDYFDGELLVVPMAGMLPADAVVALPGLVGRPVVGVPHDDAGFVAVDEFCRVQDRIHAVGDMTDRPLKQGGLAAQQADVAAAAIAAAAGEPVRPEPYEPVLRAMLLTGDGPRYLRNPRVPGLRPESVAEAPWWPPHKIAGFHLAPYLATHGELVASVRR